MNNKLEFIIKLKDEFSGTLGGIVGKLPSLGTMAAAAGAGVAAAGTAVFMMAKNTAEAYDKVQKFSEAIGVSTTFLSGMNHAAHLSGLTNEQLNVSLKMLGARIGEANAGLGEAKLMWKALGIEVKNSDGSVKSVEQMLPEVADALQNVSSASERTTIAMRIFGESGVVMLPMLMKGSEGIQAMRDEAEKFGLVISAQAGRNAAEFNDSMTRMMGSVTGIKNKFSEDLLPVFSGAFNSIANIIADNRETIVRWAGIAVDYLGKAAEFTVYAGGVIVDAFRGVHAIWEITKGSLASLTEYILNKLAEMAGKAASFMEALNFRGWLDGPIAKTRSFQATINNMGDAVGSVADQSAREVAEYWEAGMGRATGAVKGFVEKFKAGMAETVPSSGGGEGRENVLGSAAADEKRRAEREAAYKSAYDQLLNLHNQYTLSEEEQLQAWYDKQAEIFAGHSDAMLLLDETFYARQNEMRAAQQEAVNAAWEEAVLSDEEKLSLWYERQLEMYEGNAIAKAQIDQIYDKKTKDLQKKRDDDATKNRQAFYSNLEIIGRAFGKKALAFAQAVAVPEALINAYKAASNALADVRPYPLNIVAAAAALAAGLVQVANIRSVATGIAHGGMGYVPKEQTYLLDRGERVLSPKQNEDLTQFLEGQASGGVIIESLSISVLPNATDLDAIRSMDRADWEDLARDKIVPAMREAARQGFKV